MLVYVLSVLCLSCSSSTSVLADLPNITVGLLVPSAPPRFSLERLRVSEATINYFNSDPEGLFPSPPLFRLSSVANDTAGLPPVAVRASLQQTGVITTQLDAFGKARTGWRNSSNKAVVLLGAHGSEPTRAVLQAQYVYGVLQICPSSTAPELSNKILYPYFCR